MKIVKTLIAKNNQGDLFKIGLGDVNDDSMMSIYMIPFDDDLETEMLTFDFLNYNLKEEIESWDDYKVLEVSDVALMIYSNII